MSLGLIILSVLFFSSIIICSALTLAWQHFGRQNYVLVWAASYGLAALQWVLNAAGFLLESPVVLATAAACIVLGSSLFVIGARLRVRAPVRPGQLLAGGCAALVAYAFSRSLVGALAVEVAIPAAYSAAMMAAAAAAVWTHGRSLRAPERGFFVVLILAAFTQCVLAVAALLIPARATMAELGLFHAILVAGLPAVYMATGVTAILAIAGDIAAQLRLLVSNDQLTGLLNRRGMDEAGSRAIANARRHGRSVAAVICDMDSFKTLNDGHGHIAGDAALRAFARVLLGAVRQEDICARFGGDEFCVLLLDASEQDAADVMERVRTGVELLAVDRMLAGSISASFGVTSLMPGDNSVDDLIARADRALYQSKQSGRNRVTIWREMTPSLASALGSPISETAAR